MRLWIKLFFLAWVTLSFPQKKPNVVFFIADDLGAIDIPVYGNPNVRTPNIDKFASDAMVFTNAFATSPTCSPSRASILTGLMPFKNGAHENHAGINKGIVTLPVYLNKLGYRSAIAGKYHIGPEESYPFEMIHGSNIAEPGHEGDGVLWTDLKMEPVDKWLDDVSDGDSPFFLVVNDHSPHVFWPEKSEYDETFIKIPPIHIDTEETREARAKYYTDITKMDSNLGKLLSSLESHQLMEQTIIIFTSDQGPQWAFGKWSLYDYGIKVPLIIRWPGKIQNETTIDALVSLVDLTPTIFEAAGGENLNLSTNIDGKSLISFLKGETSTHRDFVYGTHTGDGNMNPTPIRMVRTKRYKYILNLAPEEKYTTHMDKTNRKGEGGGYWPSWVEKSYENDQAASVLYRYHHHPPEELYDLTVDPYEKVNLAFQPRYKIILENLRSKLNDWRREQGDYEEGPYRPTLEKKKGIPYIFD